MQNAIILHGAPNRDEYYDTNAPNMSNAHWIPWLQAQLIKHDIQAQTPEVVHSYKRQWNVWLSEVERFDINHQTILVGHSTGAGFFVKYLSIHPDLRVGKVILVAPFLDPYKKYSHFLEDFTIDTHLGDRTNGITIFNSDNDASDIHASVTLLRDTVHNSSYKEFHDYGHFCFEDMKTVEFPELLAECLS